MRLAAYILLAFILLLIYGSAVIAVFSTSTIPVTPTILIISMLFNLAIMGGGAILVAYFLHGSWSKALDAMGFKRDGMIKAILYGIVASLLFIFASSAVIEITGYKERNPLAEEIGSSLNTYILIFLPILSALSEETLFRGLIQMHLERKTGWIAAAIITSLMFSLAHLEYKAVIELIATFTFSLVLGYLVHTTKNIASPLTAHFLYNFIALLSFYLS